jgi:UDP-N-acetylglucosamine:LPS N-acetylglucosamine transferase
LRYFDKKRIKYIGILSHATRRKTKEDIDYFITISGPEPQRTVLEKKIMPHLKSLKGKVVVTLGKPEESHHYKSDKRITICGFFDSKKQEEMMNRAKFIISRLGYTTVMELAELEKKNALFIPTPGQTEQEYLGYLYDKKGYFHHVHQHKLNLLKDIHEARNFKGYKPAWKTKDSIKKFMEVISK